MMRVVSTLLLAFAIVASSAFAAEFEKEDGVIVATDSNFDDIIAANENAIVEFYAPWCGHCKALAPEFASAAKTLAADNVNAVLVKVDCTVEENLGQRFGVQGYPTLKFFRNGEDSDYSGGRTAVDIVNFLKKKTGPPATELADVAAADEITTKNELVYIGIFADVDGKEATEFKAVASDSDYVFGISSNADVAAKFGVELPALVCIRTFDEPQVNYDGDFSALSISQFVNGNALPLVVEFSSTNAAKIFGGDLKDHLLFHATKAVFKEYEEVVSSVAKSYKGKLLFIFVDVDVEDNARILEFFDVSADNVPAVRIINLAEHMKKYSLTKDVTKESLNEFVEGYLSGALRPSLKSEPVPDNWDAEPVKILTGENFYDVTKSDKFVFVEFYAPWCGHCKQIAPIWDKLGEAFEGEDNVVIAKIDATSNELEDQEIQGFPTLKLFHPDGTVSEFDGGRDIADFVKYVNEHAGTNVAVPEFAESEAVEEDSESAYEDYDYDYDEETPSSGHDEL